MARNQNKKNIGPTSVESIHHQDKRANIPTEELRDFVAEVEQAPETMLYPRDPSLDPQLVWKGKDEQDRADLAVPVVPIYIQEKIQPQALINDLLAHGARKGDRVAEEAAAYQLKLFAEFNGLPEEFDQRVDFYHHEGNWSNRMILGDSLLVMTSLAEKEGLKGKVQMIYIDPPYGIKFGSNWQVSTRKRDVKDGRAEDATRQPEQVRAFRDTWKLGIHSYLAYLRDRLVVARELLTETGSVFVQIGDENVHLVRCVMDEVLGSENFVSLITFKTAANQNTDTIQRLYDYIIWYVKSSELRKIRKLFWERSERAVTTPFRHSDEGGAEMQERTDW
jgi:adenine-specific DNA-methyltransferase